MISFTTKMVPKKGAFFLPEGSVLKITHSAIFLLGANLIPWSYRHAAASLCERHDDNHPHHRVPDTCESEQRIFFGSTFPIKMFGCSSQACLGKIDRGFQ
jgi:hypothetical protein